MHRFLAFSEQAAEEVGLPAQQHQALLAVKGFSTPDFTTGELAERLGIKRHSAVALADRLAVHGLITRRQDRDDRRRVLLKLPPKAEWLLADLSRARRAELRRLAPLPTTLLGHFHNDGQNAA